MNTTPESIIVVKDGLGQYETRVLGWIEPSDLDYAKTLRKTQKKAEKVFKKAWNRERKDGALLFQDAMYICRQYDVFDSHRYSAHENLLKSWVCWNLCRRCIVFDRTHTKVIAVPFLSEDIRANVFYYGSLSGHMVNVHTCRYKTGRCLQAFDFTWIGSRALGSDDELQLVTNGMIESDCTVELGKHVKSWVEGTLSHREWHFVTQKSKDLFFNGIYGFLGARACSCTEADGCFLYSLESPLMNCEIKVEKDKLPTTHCVLLDNAFDIVEMLCDEATAFYFKVTLK